MSANPTVALCFISGNEESYFAAVESQFIFCLKVLQPVAGEGKEKRAER